MTHITIPLDPATEARARAASEIMGRPVEDLALASVAEAMFAFFSTGDRPVDPGAGMTSIHPDLVRQAAMEAL